MIGRIIAKSSFTDIMAFIYYNENSVGGGKMMRKIFQLFFISALFIFRLSADNFTNGSCITAETLTDYSSISGSLQRTGQADEYDYYKFTATSSGNFSLISNTLSKNTTITLYSQNCASQLSTVTGSGVLTLPTSAIVSGSTYVLMLKANANGNYVYTLTNSVETPILPKADYRFDECVWNGTTGEVKDSSGNNLHGTAQGNAQPSTDAIIDHSGLFSNSTANTDAISVPDTDLLSPHVGTNGEMTISAWVKLNAYPTSALQGRIPIVAKGDNNNWEYALYIYQDHRAGFSTWQSSGSSYKEISGGNLALNTWYHITGVLKKGAYSRIYVNGTLVTESTSGFSGSTINGTSPFYIARRGSGNNYLNGYVDEVKLFASALTQPQIQSIYDNENLGKNYDGTARTPSCCCIPTGGNLIANPSFETLCGTSIIQTWNGVEGGTVNMRNNVCGWTMNGSGMETWENTTLKPASEGTVFVEIDGYNTTVDQLSQTLNALNGVHYIISFDYRARNGGSDRIIAKWNGTQIGTFTGITTGWQTAQIEVVGTGSDILAFEEPSADNNALGSWIDNIRVAEGTLTTNCTSFSYDLLHTSTPSNKLYTRIANQPFDVNATVVCVGTGDIPSRKITKIYAVAGATCPTATTGLPVIWSGSIDINQTSPIITIPSLNTFRVYSTARLMLETNASELNCSSDTFSIRPARYTMTSPSAITAGNPFNLTFKALGYADATITDYNTSISLIKALNDPTKICSVTDGNLTDESNISITGATFNDSVSTLTNARFNDIGVYNLNLKDTTWTATDQSLDCIPDSNSTILSGITGKVGCNIENNTTITVTPDHFDVNGTLSNFDGKTFTYLSTDLNMSAQLDLNITAKSANNTVLRNYDDTCYAKNTDLALVHSSVPNPLTKILYSEELSAVNTNVLKGIPWTLSLNSVLFNNGSVTPSIHLNFDRNETKPLNPFDFNITSATATDADTITGTGVPLGDTTFIFGRARAYDITTNTSPVNVPIEFEVYSTTSSGFVSTMPQNVLKWYRNLDHDTAAHGNVITGGFTAGAIDSAIDTSTNSLNPADGLQIVTVTSIHDQIIHLDISPWLWYSPKYTYDYSGNCTRHPCFNYDYTDATGGIKGVNSGTFQGSDFQMTPAKNITNKGVKIFR